MWPIFIRPGGYWFNPPVFIRPGRPGWHGRPWPGWHGRPGRPWPGRPGCFGWNCGPWR